MKSTRVVAGIPAKPLMIFDGDCNFCAFWVHRWRKTTGDRLDYVPFQDPRVAAQFPELSSHSLETAVHLVESDGAIYSGAEAAFRALAHNPQERWLFEWYEHSPAFARVSEWGYRQVAGHRRFFSALTRLAWGRQIEPPTYELVRRLFLRSIGIIYLIAFVSIWVQILGLVGKGGIMPASVTMEAARHQADLSHLGWERYHIVPTWCWLGSSDAGLKFQCGLGAAVAVLLILGIAPAPCLFLLWTVYLSLATICREFLGFQWDNLLLEAGFLSIFFAPLGWLPRRAQNAPPSRLVLWLFRWLIFRLMFASGCVKLLSGDPNWRKLTALQFHYETQPLPTWVGWYLHQLPTWAQKSSTLIMFAVELVVPFLVFAPRRVRQVACVAFIALQMAILLTGNYCFFNLLTIALCLPLLDDAALERILPPSWRSSAVPLNLGGPAGKPARRWPRVITVPLGLLLIVIPLMQFSATFSLRFPWPRPLAALYEWVSPFRSVNQYGLFAVMTTKRPELVIEGSNDKRLWIEYNFKYKPGDVHRRPGFVEPHQPRLDWQMWFAALGNYQQNPWIVNLCVRLLQGAPEVEKLLANNPFAESPPRYIRVVVYEYHFTDWRTGRKTRAWWRRELKGIYLPIISVNE